MLKILKNVVLLPLGVKSKNDRYYVKGSFKDMKPEYYGEIGFSNSDDLYLGDVSHLVKNIKINNNEIIGDVEILNTTNGKILLNLLNDGFLFVFRPKSLVTIENGCVKNSKIISFDAIQKDDDPYYSIREQRKDKLIKIKEIYRKY